MSRSATCTSIRTRLAVVVASLGLAAAGFALPAHPVPAAGASTTVLADGTSQSAPAHSPWG